MFKTLTVCAWLAAAPLKVDATLTMAIHPSVYMRYLRIAVDVFDQHHQAAASVLRALAFPLETTVLLTANVLRDFCNITLGVHQHITCVRGIVTSVQLAPNYFHAMVAPPLVLMCVLVGLVYLLPCIFV